MCGFTGYFDPRADHNELIINKMTDSLLNRGPDSSGIFIDKNIHEILLGFNQNYRNLYWLEVEFDLRGGSLLSGASMPPRWRGATGVFSNHLTGNALMCGGFAQAVKPFGCYFAGAMFIDNWIWILALVGCRPGRVNKMGR